MHSPLSQTKACRGIDIIYYQQHKSASLVAPLPTCTPVASLWRGIAVPGLGVVPPEGISSAVCTKGFPSGLGEATPGIRLRADPWGPSRKHWPANNFLPSMPFQGLRGIRLLISVAHVVSVRYSTNVPPRLMWNASCKSAPGRQGGFGVFFY